MKTKYYRRITWGIAFVLASASVTACSGGKSTSAMQYAAETAAAAMDRGSEISYSEIPQSPDMEYNEYEGIEISENDMVVEPGSGAGLTSSTTIQPVNTGRKLIRTVSLNVETTDFIKLLDSLTQAVTSMGGYIEQSDISGNSISDSQDRRNAYLTVRVPSNKLDGFVAQVDAEGNITNKSENTQDVTLQYSDIESRKKTLAVEQERLWDLLAQADSMDAVIALESRLSEIRYQLETMESQLRTYDNQVDYSTVMLNINEVKVFTPTAPDSVLTRIHKGFSRNLKNVGNGAVNFMVWFLSSLPVLVVFAAIAGTAYIILHRITHKIPRKQKQKNAKPFIPTLPSKEEKPDGPMEQGTDQKEQGNSQAEPDSIQK